MSYQVLARKWRPRAFTELVGQTHVLQALVNALDHDRLHHAYLFTGTRGVGKTTIARIFAKCLNCTVGVSATPCGQCPACRDIDAGCFVDLIEVDAASRTKVEDTRELLDNVQYVPTQGRYKVYLIDEVHMLSTHSFNALLKTLEEPPPHIKFLLATTDSQKLPVTILSRCLQFGLKNMTPERIVEHLETILQQENITYEAAALWLLARAADGSMRDALSLTDQAIAFGNGLINAAHVSTMLGTIDHGQVMKMVQALTSGSATTVLSAASQLAEHAPDYATVLDDMLSVFHRVAIAQAVPDAVSNSQGDQAEIKQLASAITAEDVQLYYQIGLLSKKDLPLAPDPREGFEMALLRMLAFRPEEAPTEQALPNAATSTGTTTPTIEAATTKEIHSNSDHAVDRPDGPIATASLAQPVAIPVMASTDTAPAAATSPSAPSAAVTTAVFPNDNNQPTHLAIEPPAPPTSTLAATPSPPRVASEQTTQAQPNGAHLPLLDAQTWLTVFPQLPLTGVTGTIASHCEYKGYQDGNLQLRMDEQRSTLYNETHRVRIEQALSTYFDQAIQLHVTVGAIQAETPAGQHARNKAERQQQAQQAINNDPQVQQLINDFSACVLEHTVAPVAD